jgi:hypothetical protein
VWNLFDEGEPHRHEPAIFCEWCGVSLEMFQEGGGVQHPLLTRHSTHICNLMAKVETQRNEKNAYGMCRSYLIRWLPKSGWTLLYKGYPTTWINLDECIFCHIGFPFFNQVLID